MYRREFLRCSTGLVGSLSFSPSVQPVPQAPVTASKLPRWRGFNLIEKCFGARKAPFQESDFALMAEWGFDLVRLPLSYLCWSDLKNWRQLDETSLREVDHAVALGRKYHIHVNINLHRAPGYCVNPPKEPFDLWKDAAASDACCYHWNHLAERYKGLPSTEVSFNLLNEPALIPAATYARVVRRLVESIRERDPGRLIIADGLGWGKIPIPALVELKIAQSTRGYDPMQVSHYRASWVRGADRWPEPTWPLAAKGVQCDKERLRERNIRPWKELEQNGVGVQVGEWGAHNQTPHKVVLAWMRDQLDLWREAGWGWSLWNFRGSFGILDSGRLDVAYENFRGYKLDRAMLELLRADLRHA
jgi:endoglucanase